MDSYTYSDQPVQHYMLDLGGARCEVATLVEEFGREECLPYWNLFWLSNPLLDKLPDAGKDWWRVYSPVPGLMQSIIKDITGDYTLHHALTLHPAGFLEWWQEQCHSDFLTYTNTTGQRWVETVTRRAEIASDRALSQFPPVVRSGNVLVLADYRTRP